MGVVARGRVARSVARVSGVLASSKDKQGETKRGREAIDETARQVAASTAGTLTRTETRHRPEGSSYRQDSKTLDGAVAQLGIWKGGEGRCFEGDSSRKKKRKRLRDFT